MDNEKEEAVYYDVWAALSKTRQNPGLPLDTIVEIIKELFDEVEVAHLVKGLTQQ